MEDQSGQQGALQSNVEVVRRYPHPASLPPDGRANQTARTRSLELQDRDTKGAEKHLLSRHDVLHTLEERPCHPGSVPIWLVRSPRYKRQRVWMVFCGSRREHLPSLYGRHKDTMASKPRIWPIQSYLHGRYDQVKAVWELL